MYTKFRLLLLNLLFLIIATTNGLPKEDSHRIFDGELSDKTQHYENQEHNVNYDHEAFLGSDEAKTFDQLPPEESKRRLGVIVDKIDNDNDTFITREELKDWIRFTQKRYISEDVNRQWQQLNPDGNETISWEHYRKLVYGFLDHGDSHVESTDEATYRAMMKRDRRRWAAADQNHDDNLSKEDFAAFLHPEEVDYLRDIVIQETMEDIDKDGDGKVSLMEYIGDMYRPSENDEEEPDWVQSEREQFKTYRDKNGDGFMDGDEIKAWILPDDFDHADAEARHLIYEADSDADEQLTKDEILKKYDLFVGSQATDFGEALVRHDEF